MKRYISKIINLPASFIKTIFWGLFYFALFSCNSELEEEIIWKLDDHPDMLVVEGLITNRSEKQVVFLTQTGPYLTNDPPRAVSGAIVTVSDGTITYEYTENETNNGEYISDTEFQGIPGDTYKLHITLNKPLNSISEYAASSVMPMGIDIDSIVCEVYQMPDLGFPTDEDMDTTILGITYFGQEPVDQDNYYLAVISANNRPWYRNTNDLIRFTDDQNNGSHSDFILFIQNTVPGDTIGFEVSSVERKYYEYIGNIQLMDQSGSAYSMSGPPANAVGNIPGALGYFRTAYISGKQGIAVDISN